MTLIFIDKEILEKVQKRAISMTSGLSGSTYKEKLREVGLTSLEERRKREDMIQVWKILHGHDHVDKNILFAQLMYLAKMKDKPECPVIL